MKPETIIKIRACKALQNVSVRDMLRTERFQKNMEAYLNAQKEDRTSYIASYADMRKLGVPKGYKMPAHVIDRILDLSVEDFTEAYFEVIQGVSDRSAAERLYISQLGQQAYNLTMAQIVCEEFPELEKELIPKSNAS